MVKAINALSRKIKVTGVKMGPFEEPKVDAKAGQLNWVEIPPASTNSSGKVGDVSCDTDYLYVCIAPDTWERCALDVWKPADTSGIQMKIIGEI